MKKDQQEIKVTYHYVEPKTKEEAEEAKRRLDAAFDILFEATLVSEDSTSEK